MTNSVILNDVILGDGYIKVVTDQGSFIRELHGEQLDSLALKALKSVGMRINIELCPDDQFSGVFKDIHVIGQEEERNQFPLRKEFNAKTSQKIYGPPGTGKTTKLIDYVSAEVLSGTSPQDIAFISFSNGAATVARKRVVEKLPQYGTVDFPNFSTMHSLATKVGSEGGMKLMVEEHFLGFDDTIECWQEWTELANPLGAVERYRHPILDEYNLAIAECRSPNFASLPISPKQKTLLAQRLQRRFGFNGDKDFTALAKEYTKAFLAYKKERRLMTFDDVIEKVVAADFPSELIPTFDLLIIDEAQDLSNHLWKFAKKLISNARTTFIAGDADQAIMIGIGANPDAFVGLKTSENDDALKSSFRVPKTSRSYAEKGIIKALEKLPNRVGVSWDPANREGYLNAGFRTLEQHPEHGPVIVGHEFSIDYLLQRIKQHYLLFGSGETEFNDNLFLQNSEFIIRQTLRLNQITNVKISELLEAAVTELDVKDLRDLQIKIGKGEILASEVIGCGVMDGDLVDLESLPDIDDTVDVPDWLVMAPTKRTGEQLSKALEEINVPHFHRNKPILHAEKEQTLIRVQTVHMSKGDEATNAAIVVGSEADVRMLADDVRLAYVAATRASHACFPRVARKDLLPLMYSNQYWRPIVKGYNSIFPIG